MKNVLIVLTFFSLWLSTRLNAQFQDYMAYAFILTFGVLHGSNDINILARLPIGKNQNRSLLTKYILAVVAVIAVFLFSKLLALLFFLFISGYHFGEQHLKESFRGPLWLALPLYLVYGLTILFMIFYLKVDEVVPIFFDITDSTFEAPFFKIGFYGLVSVLVLLSGLYYWRSMLKVNPFKELFILLVFMVVFKTASLVWAFCIYFIVWHSLPSLYDQMFFLYGTATKSTFLKYLRSSWLYWLISIVGLVLLYFILRDNTDYFITVVLYVLAAITFPHVLVMSKLEQE